MGWRQPIYQLHKQCNCANCANCAKLSQRKSTIRNFNAMKLRLPQERRRRASADTFAVALEAAGLLADDNILPPPALWAVHRRRRALVGLGWILMTLLLVVIGFAGYAYYRGEELVQQFQAGAKLPLIEAALPQLNITPPKESPLLKKELSGSTVFLIAGSDIRFGSGGNGNSDTILLVDVNATTKTVSILSLPRDLYVNIPGYGMAKINAAYSIGGPALLIETIRDFIGVRINHFVDVDFYGFESITNDLGGVYLPIDSYYYHVSEPTPAEDWSSIDIKPGYQLLKGSRALEWVRFRHEDSDFYRVARQQIFLREVARQVRAEFNLTNLPLVIKLIHDTADATASDIHSLPYLISLANTLRGIPSSHVVRVTLQAQGYVNGAGDVLIPTTAEEAAAVHAWVDPQHTLSQQYEPATVPATTHKKSDHSPAAITPLLVSDDGSAERLLAPYHNLQLCTPTKLPPDYSWGVGYTTREYKLDGHHAVEAWASAGSGNSILWMWSTWQDPPILSDPSQTISRNGRDYQLYYDSGALRQIAWQIGSTRVWITNTLLNNLSDREMIELAESCQTT